MLVTRPCSRPAALELTLSMRRSANPWTRSALWIPADPSLTTRCPGRADDLRQPQPRIQAGRGDPPLGFSSTTRSAPQIRQHHAIRPSDSPAPRDPPLGLLQALRATHADGTP